MSLAAWVWAVGVRASESRASLPAATVPAAVPTLSVAAPPSCSSVRAVDAPDVASVPPSSVVTNRPEVVLSPIRPSFVMLPWAWSPSWTKR
jgi:hypothetical protein